MSAVFSSRRGGNLFQPLERFLESLEEPLIVSKPRAMIDSAARDHTRRMLNMQHLVIQHVLYDEAWDCRVIECAADDYCPMDVVVVTEHTPRLALAPGKHREFELTVEVARIQLCEQLG